MEPLRTRDCLLSAHGARSLSHTYTNWQSRSSQDYYSPFWPDERFLPLLPFTVVACSSERLSCCIQFLRAVDAKRVIDFFT
jgi:hypothetical protein